MYSSFHRFSSVGNPKLHSQKQLTRRFVSKDHKMSGSEMVELCKKHTMWSWSAQGKVTPIPVEKSEGIYFWDTNGKRYIDFNSQLMCSNLGYGNKKIIEAIKNQAEELCYSGPAMATRVRAEIGPLLSKHTPGDLTKFFFTLGGSEANENAIKFARFHTGRNKIVTRYRSYHGATHGSIILTGDPRRWPNEPGMGGVVRVFDPYKYRSHLYNEGDSDEVFSEKCLHQLEETLMYENPYSFAAIFIETITGTNGIIIPPNGYLQGLRKICDKYGILLVCDEVMAGLGRTGEWFSVNHWNVVPDIITCAKGLTSAYLPLGAVCLSEKIAKSFDERPFLGGLTYQSHPMCLAAAVANLRVIEEDDIVGNSKKMGKVLSELHLKMKEKHPSVGDVRSIGLFGCLELVKNRKTKEPMAPFNGTSEPIQKISGFLKEKGLFHFFAGHILHTNPPLIINEDQLKECFAIIDEGLKITDQFVEP